MIRHLFIISKEVKAPIERVYLAFLNEEDLKKWYHSTNDWATPYAHVDEQIGGRFKIRFEDPKRFNSYDYEGTFTKLEKPHHIEYKLDDGNLVRIRLSEKDGVTLVEETYESDSARDLEFKAKGKELILNNLVNYLSK